MYDAAQDKVIGEVGSFYTIKGDSKTRYSCRVMTTTARFWSKNTKNTKRLKSRGRLSRRLRKPRARNSSQTY